MTELLEKIEQLTPDALRDEIAKRKGYTILHGYMDAACINPMDYWVTPEGRVTSVLPDWTRDIAAAFELWDEMAATEHVTLDSYDDKCECAVDDYTRTLRGYAEKGEEALAISRAWAMWKERQK